ncbi:hypothetical protein SBF1_830012 [Candidatus Desulfosporosinus infrequens]|uniref:Uncharacterized protein n=1 Tax=Candidatus Desulfosporosinus infrequens TaxID=2043169 RepID=A0A2U3LU85_9FIRM|nr:hypothetical protein SBF1_830012 [Candidatus Desulfosporosinus infrequens]
MNVLTDEQLLAILQNLKETQQIMHDDMNTIRCLVGALIKLSEQGEMQRISEVLRSLQSAFSDHEQMHRAASAALDFVSSVTVSNKPEDMRKLFSVVKGGKDS